MILIQESKMEIFETIRPLQYLQYFQRRLYVRFVRVTYLLICSLIVRVRFTKSTAYSSSSSRYVDLNG
jgi:hypothetical protein